MSVTAHSEVRVTGDRAPRVDLRPASRVAWPVALLLLSCAPQTLQLREDRGLSTRFEVTNVEQDGAIEFFVVGEYEGKAIDQEEGVRIEGRVPAGSLLADGLVNIELGGVWHCDTSSAFQAALAFDRRAQILSGAMVIRVGTEHSAQLSISTPLRRVEKRQPPPWTCGSDGRRKRR